MGINKRDLSDVTMAFEDMNDHIENNMDISYEDARVVEMYTFDPLMTKDELVEAFTKANNQGAIEIPEKEKQHFEFLVTTEMEGGSIKNTLYLPGIMDLYTNNCTYFKQLIDYILMLPKNDELHIYPSMDYRDEWAMNVVLFSAIYNAIEMTKAKTIIHFNSQVGVCSSFLAAFADEVDFSPYATIVFSGCYYQDVVYSFIRNIATVFFKKLIEKGFLTEDEYSNLMKNKNLLYKYGSDINVKKQETASDNNQNELETSTESEEITMAELEKDFVAEEALAEEDVNLTITDEQILADDDEDEEGEEEAKAEDDTDGEGDDDGEGEEEAKLEADDEESEDEDEEGEPSSEDEDGEEEEEGDDDDAGEETDKVKLDITDADLLRD